MKKTEQSIFPDTYNRASKILDNFLDQENEDEVVKIPDELVDVVSTIIRTRSTGLRPTLENIYSDVTIDERDENRKFTLTNKPILGRSLGQYLLIYNFVKYEPRDGNPDPSASFLVSIIQPETVIKTPHIISNLVLQHLTALQ